MTRVLKMCGTDASYQRGCRCIGCLQAHAARVKQDTQSSPTRRAHKVDVTRDWRSKNPARHRNNKLATYGLTHRQWLNILESQGGVCGSCSRTEPDWRYGWVVDHDHETGLVRGLLCQRCNLTLGMLGDTEPKIIERTAQLLAYLRRGIG